MGKGSEIKSPAGAEASAHCPTPPSTLETYWDAVLCSRLNEQPLPLFPIVFIQRKQIRNRATQLICQFER